MRASYHKLDELLLTWACTSIHACMLAPSHMHVRFDSEKITSSWMTWTIDKQTSIQLYRRYHRRLTTTFYAINDTNINHANCNDKINDPHQWQWRCQQYHVTLRLTTIAETTTLITTSEKTTLISTSGMTPPTTTPLMTAPTTSIKLISTMLTIMHESDAVVASNSQYWPCLIICHPFRL